MAVGLMRGEMVSNQFNAIPPIPTETARSARAIFGHRNFYILVGEHLESILEDIQPQCLLAAGVIFPQITFFQFLEGLTDAQAINAARTRLDWKFALHLPVYPPMFHERALCEFRRRILMNSLCQCEFQRLIDRLITFNPPLNNRFQDFKNLELVSTVCSVNRWDLIHESISKALEALACKFPIWLRNIALPHWYGRYSYITLGFNSTESHYQQELSIQEIGVDIHHLLDEIHRSSPPEISKLPEIKTLDHVWQHLQKKYQTTDEMQGVFKWNDCDSCIYLTGGKWHSTS